MNNYHTHTFYCGHAGGTVKEYVETAIKNGIKILGFSEHAPFKIFDDRMSYEDFLQYLKDIEECQKEYSSQITILKGLEIEYIEDQLDYIKELKSKLDYLCFGAHFYNDGPDILNKSTYEITSKKQIREYGKYVIRAIKSGLFDFIAHPDLYMINYPKFDRTCKRVTHQIFKVCEKYDAILEINANGIRRGLSSKKDGVYYSYPCYKFWEIGKKYKVKVIVGSDSHNPKNLCDEAFLKANEYARSLGLEIVDSLSINMSKTKNYK